MEKNNFIAKLILLSIVFSIISSSLPTYGEELDSINYKEQLDKNLEYIIKTVENPTFGTLNGEWSILTLSRAGYEVPEGYYEKYYNNAVNEVKTIMSENGILHRAKSTEHSRLILGLTSIGKDVTDVAGYDVTKALADFNYVKKQGINGSIFALIALDSHDYEIPAAEGATVQTTRELLINFILDREIEGGGWALGSSPTEADPDITAMAIQGFTPYYETSENVKASVDRAIIWLSEVQENDGGYSSWGTANSESIAQVVVALTGLRINPHTDVRFIKNGNSVIDALLTFAAPEGGFMHIKPGTAGNGGASEVIIDGMATDQGTYALVSYDRFLNGKTRFYDMNDIETSISSDINIITRDDINSDFMYITEAAIYLMFLNAGIIYH